MTIPSVTLTSVDPGLPKSVPGTVTPLIAGTATSGTVDLVASFASEKAVIDAYTSGPLVEAALDCLRKGGAPVLCCRLTGSVVAAATAVTKSGSGPDITLTGDALDQLDLLVEITTGGAIGSSMQFRYSLDGGVTYSQTRGTAASTFLMPGTGVTLNFAAGTYVALDTYTATCLPAYQDSTDIADLQAALLASPRLFDFLHIAGQAPSASAAATLFASLATLCDALAAAKKYRSLAFIASAGDDSVATTVTAFSSTTSAYGMVGYGRRYAPAFVPIEGRGFREKECAQDLAAVISGQLISTDVSRLSIVFGDTLANDDGSPRISHDEYLLQSIDDQGFATYRTWPGRAGVFFTNPRMKSPFGSDFTYFQRRLVFNRAQSVAYSRFVDWISRNIRTNPDNVPSDGDEGTPLEEDAIRVESYVNDALADNIMRERNADGFAGHATAVQFSLDRHYNTLASDGLQGAIELVPLTSIKRITSTIGFVRSIGA